MAGGSSEVRTISDEEWQSKRDQVNVSKEHLNMLVLNFLQTEVRPTLIDTGPGISHVGATRVWQQANGWCVVSDNVWNIVDA